MSTAVKWSTGNPHFLNFVLWESSINIYINLSQSSMGIQLYKSFHNSLPCHILRYISFLHHSLFDPFNDILVILVVLFVFTYISSNSLYIHWSLCKWYLSKTKNCLWYVQLLLQRGLLNRYFVTKCGTYKTISITV